METINQALLGALAVQCGRQAELAFSRAAQGVSRAMEELPLGFPPGPRYDVALELSMDPLSCMERLKASYGDVCGFKLATQPVVLVSSPRSAKDVFDSSTFVKAGTAFFPGSSLAGNGLLVSDGETWLRQRRLSNPAFRKAAVESYAEAMTSSTYELVRTKWHSSGVRDVYADMNELTMKIVGTALFGGSAGDTTMQDVVSNITTAFKFFTERATSMFIVPEWLPTPGNIQYHAAVASLDSVVYQMIKNRRNQLASSVNVRGDLLTRLLQAKDEDGTSMDDLSLRDELMTLLVAGQETSSIVLAWCLSMLAVHEEVQEKMFSELSRVLGDGKPSPANVKALQYTEAVVLETMRLLPPAYIVGRCASDESVIGEWSIPAGTTALVGLYLLHRDPQHWPRASEFDPERWLPSKGAKAYIGGGSYWPFGGGARNCIGAGFAMLELTLVLAILVRTHKILLPGAKLPLPQAMITLRPPSPLHLQVTKRR